jgi:hypothetical protein
MPTRFIIRREVISMAFQFNPERVAYFEATGWRAYYERRWLKMLRLVVALCQEQFHIPFPVSLLAAYYTTRASIAWVPVNHDVQKVRIYLEKFYCVARRYSGLRFDPVHVAALELRYFDVHRRLVGAEDKNEFVQALVDLHSALFDLPPDQVRESATLRVQAADVVDRITGKKSTDIAGDWILLEKYLRQCYTSVQHALAA